MKRYIISISSIMLAVIFCIGTAFSSWYFIRIQRAAEKNITLKQDDIKENNETASLSSVYTIYFFPSALYINDYIDYLDGNSETKPEDLYGYIEPSLDDTGNVIYNENGSVQYDRHSSKMYSGLTYGGDGGYIGEKLRHNTSSTDSTDSTDSSDYEKLYLVEDTTGKTTRTGILSDILAGSSTYSIAHAAYTTYYTGDSAYSTLSAPSTVIEGGTKKWDEEVYAYYDSNKDGIITNDKKDYFPRYYIGDGDLDSPSNTLTNFKEDRYNNRNQHVYDRFGAWRYVEYGDGRFMPLKITVDENFSFEYLSEVMKEPITSMCDNNQWFNLTFSEWSYVDTKTKDGDSSYTLPYYASIAKDYSGISAKQFRVTNAFKSFDMAQTFDVMQDFSKYADKDNVIRLFPTFSNGKNYIASTDVGNYLSDKNAFGAGVSATTVGGGDTLQAEFSYTDTYKEANPLADGMRVAAFSTATVDTYTNATVAVNDEGTKVYTGKTSAYYSGDSASDNKATYLFDSGEKESYSLTYEDLKKDGTTISSTATSKEILTNYYFLSKENYGNTPNGYYQIYVTENTKTDTATTEVLVWVKHNQSGSHTNYYTETNASLNAWGFNIILPGGNAQVLGGDDYHSGTDMDLGLLLAEKLVGCRIFKNIKTDSSGNVVSVEKAGTPISLELKVNNVKYAVWQNINFNNLSNLNFSFQATHGACNWVGTSYSLYKFTSDSLQSIMKTYGDGLYNVYVFMGDAYHEKYDSSRGTSGVCIGNIVKDATSSKTLFNGELYGKDLLAITGTSATDPNYTTSSRSFNCASDSSNLDSYRSFVIAIEKVCDIKIITNLNIDSLKIDNETGQLTNELQIQSIYDSSNATFSYSSETYYGISLSGTNNLKTGAEVNNNGTNTLIKDADGSNKALNGSFPYIMYLGGVDLTNVTGDYFQLRFGKEYLNNENSNLYFQGLAGVANKANIDANEDEDGIFKTSFRSYAPNVALVTTQTDTENKTVLDRVYKNPFGVGGYFSPIVSDSDENGGTQVFFKLNDESCKGVYDFLLVYVPETYYTDVDGNLLESIPTDNTTYYEHPVGYYIYAHRQSNVFVKILTQDVSKKDGDGFVVHDVDVYSSTSSDSDSSSLLFQRSYYLGLTISGDDVSNDIMLAQSVNEYVRTYLENNSGLSITDIILRDHVTTAVVAGYKEVENQRIEEWKGKYKQKYGVSDDDAAKAAENYFYAVKDNSGTTTYYELIFETFVVRKNYIFYVTDKNKAVAASSNNG